MPLSAPDLVAGYSTGIFPMAGDDGSIDWYRPDPRAVIPLDEFHVPSSLARVVRSGRFQITTDMAFPEVMRACADRRSTWINDEIVTAYVALHEIGLAHSVESRGMGGELQGGLYGVALGGAFFGESMFSRATDASKVALVHLVERMRRGGFTLLDTQFLTDHLMRFGATLIRRREYERRLVQALALPADWYALDGPATEAGTAGG